MQTDKMLIKAIKRRQSNDAANELISRYYKEIYAYTFRQTGEVELTKDLTQEIFIHILEKLSAFDEKKASFRTWVYRVASNKITDYYRSRSYREYQQEQMLVPEEDEADSLLTDLSELMIRKEIIGKVMEVVATYQSEWIRIFQKKCFEEMTFLEISKELDLSENTVKSRFYQMIRRIKKEVDIDEG